MAKRSGVWVGPFCLLAIFAGVLTGRDRLAFRDVGYFYTPLYAFVDEQCDAAGRGWFGGYGRAIWNARDQTGMPLAGETTTAVFYPLRMIVYAPSWSAETAIGVYVFLHLVIASIGAYAAARRFRCDRGSAATAGVVYPLSGIVLFLATNPPFLVGAAWLPWVITPLISWRSRQVAVPAMAMAMIILGGDPPTALHALIAAGVVNGLRVVGWCYSRLRDGRAEPQASVRLDRRLSLWSGCRQMILVPVLAGLLAAPQIAASVAWSSCSDRVQPSSAPESSARRQQAFAFSVPPWRWAEMVVPNLYGSPWPVNTRWDRLAFDRGVTRLETALWTPTLYCGIMFPILWGATAWAFFLRTHRRRSAAQWQWQWCVVLAWGVLASMGSFGPVYRLLHDFLPGYDSLRYPSKWLPLVAISVSVMTAMILHRWQRQSRWRTTVLTDQNRVRTAVLALAAAVIFVCVGVFGAQAIGRWQTPTRDPFWGPFVAEAAISQWWFSCVHVALVGIASVSLASVWMIRRRRCHVRYWIVLAVIDLMIAHSGLVPQIDRVSERQILNQLEPAPSAPRRWMRLHRENGFATEWSAKSSDDRMLFVEAGVRHSWFGRWHLETDSAVVNSMVSIGPREMAEFWYYSRRLDGEFGAGRIQRWRGWCEMLGVSGYVHCGGAGHAVGSDPAPVGLVPPVTWEVFNDDERENASPAGRRVQFSISELPDDRSLGWRELLKTYAEPASCRPAFVSPSVAAEFRRQAAASESSAPSSAPKIVSRRVYQDGHWRATLVSADRPSRRVSAEVFAVDYLSQGVIVPPGDWRVEFEYSPWWHRPAILAAAAAWFILWVGGIRRCRKSGHRRWRF